MNQEQRKYHVHERIEVSIVVFEGVDLTHNV